MKRALAMLALIATLAVLVGGSAGAAVAVTAKYQLRGHLPELGERPTMRVFVTQAQYDSYRNSLGDANVFPPASSMFMSFDKDILALYTRGNDTGGRCIGTQILASFSGDTLAATASWQSGTCGAPSNAHYPFILFSLSRTASDGTAWVASARSVCLSVESPDTSACAPLSGAVSPAPTATATSAPTAAPAATPSPTATRSLTPSQTVAAVSPTPAATSVPSVSRSPAAAASPAATAGGVDTNVLLYAMLIAIGLLVLLSLFLSRGGRRG